MTAPLPHDPGRADPHDLVRVEAIVRKVAAVDRPRRCGRTLVVALDGPSGSGKTTLATALAARLRQAPLSGRPVVGLVHMDHVYPGWGGLTEGVDVLATQVLEPIRAGRPGSHGVWDWRRDTWSGRRREVPVPDVLVVEGCGSGAYPAGAYADVLVFVEADPQVRHERAVTRDGETEREHLRQWGRAERVLFAQDRTRERADLVVDTSGPRPERPGRGQPQ